MFLSVEVAVNGSLPADEHVLLRKENATEHTPGSIKENHRFKEMVEYLANKGRGRRITVDFVWDSIIFIFFLGLSHDECLTIR